jgi:Carboxypeptidase regulatory-like domain
VRLLLYVCLLALVGHVSGGELQVAQAPASPAPGVITGIVRDESGTPVVGAVVQAIVRRKRWAGPYYETPVGRPDESDDRGQFRLHSLPPGSYVVAVSMQPSQPQRPSPSPPETTEYVRTYSPNATALADAQPVAVQPGAEQSVAVRLAPVRFVSVSGIARTSAGQPAANFTVLLRGGPETVRYTGPQGGFITTRVAGARVEANGSYSLMRVPAGTYVLEVTNGNSRQAQNPLFEIAEIPVEVRDAPLTGVTVVTAPGATVSGRLEWRGSGPVPWLREPGGPVRIRATGLGRESDVAAIETEIQPDGTFRFTNMYALRRIVTMSLSINWTIAAVEGPKDLMVGRSIDVTPGRDITELRVIVIERPGSLMATVSDENDKPYDGWVVLMSRVPDDLDAMGWGFGATQSNYGAAGVGYYRMERLTPGPYLVAAVDVEPSRLTGDTNLMERARAGAVPVDIREGEQTQLNVRLVRLRPFVQNP